MNRSHGWEILSSVLMLAFVAAPAFAENDGQEDLDKATQLKVTAETLDDLAEVIDRLETALEKGLDKSNEEFAEQLLVASLVQRGSLFTSALMSLSPDDPTSAVRIPQFRTWALNDLQRAVELDNQVWEAYVMIGKVQAAARGDARAAKRALTKVVDADEAPPELKAEALALRSDVQREAEQQLADLNRAIELEPKKLDYLRQRAEYLHGKEKFDDALADVERALKLEPEDADIIKLRGLILLGMEKYEEALASFDRASELAPDDALPYQQRGELYRKKGDPEKAVEQLSKALELAPNNVPTLLFRAGVYYELEQTDKALDDVEQAIRVNPGLVYPHLMRAEIYAATDRMDKAIDQLEQLLRMSPGNTPILNRLGSFYLMAGRPRKTIETFSQIVEQDPENFEALRYRGDAYLNIGQHAEAIADFERALAIEDNDESLLNNFAWVLATSPDDEVRDGQRAIKLATKAAELTNHQTPHVLSTLGAAYAETGDFDSAKKWSQKAVELAQKTVDSATADDDRKKLQSDVEQLQEELESYEKGEPVRERQTAEEAGDDSEDDTQKPDEDQKPDSDDTLAPASTPSGSARTGDH
jgi:tetratricopeptide (TPR) repeat protein